MIIKIGEDEYWNGQVRREAVVEKDGRQIKIAVVLPDTSTNEERQAALDAEIEKITK